MLREVIESVKRVARDVIMPSYLNVSHGRKQDGSVFTQADIATQEALIRDLTALGNYPVLGEEMAVAEQSACWEAGRDGVWCIDPIDGTSNFVNGIPYFAVSVALMRGGRTELGVVYDPVADEAFHAERGHGAFLDGVPLPIKTSLATLRESIANVDFKRLPSPLAEALGRKPPYSSHRNFGASALEWCYLAAGRFDLYLHGGQKLWDYAAGSLILEEAGGKFCTLYEDEFAGDVWKRSVVAARSADLLTEWRDWVRSKL